MQRNLLVMLPAVAAVYAAGCAESEFSVAASGRGRKGLHPSEQARMTAAQEELPPKILPVTYFAAGQLLERQGRVESALHQYRRAISVAHLYDAAHHRMGLLLSQAGRRAEALESLLKAVEIGPSNAVYRNNLGYEFMLHERWADAEREFERALELDPQFVRARINLSMTLTKLDRFDEALAGFRTVLPEPDAYYNLGLMLRGQQRYQEAVDAFHHVLSLSPQFSAATAQLEQLSPRLERLAWNTTPASVTATYIPDSFLIESGIDVSLTPMAGSESGSTDSSSSSSLTQSDLWTGPEEVERTDFPGYAGAMNDWDSSMDNLPSPVAFPSLDLSRASTPPTTAELAAALAIARNEIACLEEQTAQFGMSWASTESSSSESSDEEYASHLTDESSSPANPFEEWLREGESRGTEEAGADPLPLGRRRTMGMSILPSASNSSESSPPIETPDNSFLVPLYWHLEPVGPEQVPFVGPPAPPDDHTFLWRPEQIDEVNPRVWKGWNPDLGLVGVGSVAERSTESSTEPEVELASLPAEVSSESSTVVPAPRLHEPRMDLLPD